MNTSVNYRIDDELLNDVNAGTFTPNYFPDNVYMHAGFSLYYHLFEKDEFVLNGKVYHEDEANALMKQLGYKRVERTFNKGQGRSIEYWCNDQLICCYDFFN